MSEKISFGHWGEDIAANYLESKGYEVLKRNYHCRAGEVDIIALDPSEQLVFVEVKTRKHLCSGAGVEAIHKRKRQRLKRAAFLYLSKEKTSFVPKEENYRFDAIEILVEKERKQAHISHFMNI